MGFPKDSPGGIVECVAACMLFAPAELDVEELDVQGFKRVEAAPQANCMELLKAQLGHCGNRCWPMGYGCRWGAILSGCVNLPLDMPPFCWSLGAFLVGFRHVAAHAGVPFCEYGVCVCLGFCAPSLCAPCRVLCFRHSLCCLLMGCGMGCHFEYEPIPPCRGFTPLCCSASP